MIDDDEKAADHARRLTASAMALTDKLLDDLGDRSGFSLDADVRGLLRSDWIVLVATHLVDNHSSGERDLDARFPRPVVCAWCGNRHRAAVPFETRTQGDSCAASVFQATTETAEKLARPPNRHSQPPSVEVGEWLVKGHYGSSGYDCALFRFAKNAPTAPADPICDNCVGERITTDDLVRIEGHFP